MENVLPLLKYQTVPIKSITLASLVPLGMLLLTTSAHTSLITAPWLMIRFAQNAILITQLLLMENAHTSQE